MGAFPGLQRVPFLLTRGSQHTESTPLAGKGFDWVVGGEGRKMTSWAWVDSRLQGLGGGSAGVP